MLNFTIFKSYFLSYCNHIISCNTSTIKKGILSMSIFNSSPSQAMEDASKDAVGLVSMIYDITQQSGDYAPSLTQYTKKTSVVSNAYIDDKLVNEPIMVDLMSMINQTYIGYVLAALSLNNLITAVPRVRKSIAAISTESFDEAAELVSKAFNTLEVSNEATVVDVDSKVSHLTSSKVIEFDFVRGIYNTSGSKDSSQLDQDKDNAGKTEIQSIKVPIHVSIVPHSIDKTVVDAFLANNFTVSMSKRWKQYKAGEIRLFRDFILANDLVKKFQKGLAKDKSGILSSIAKRANKGKFSWLKGISTQQYKNNAASSIFVVEKQSFNEALNSAGISFNSFKDRQNYFNKSFSMMVVVVDNLYENVDIYYNGLESYTSVPFSLVKKKGGGSGELNLKDLMDAVSSSKAPRF